MVIVKGQSLPWNIIPSLQTNILSAYYVPQTIWSAERTKEGVPSALGAQVEEAGVQTREAQLSTGSAETGVKNAFQVLGGQRWSRGLRGTRGRPHSISVWKCA